MSRPLKLKPCPFCHGADAFVERGDICIYYVFCNDCAAKGPPVEHGDFGTSDDPHERRAHRAAAKAWNTRLRSKGKVPSP